MGLLIIVSGPSGSGKSTLIRRVLANPPIPLRLAVSATTRPPREGEIDGVHYHFWDRNRFQSALSQGAFLEHAVVHGQHYYGTPREEVDKYIEEGKGVILDIDVQGADQVRRLYPEHLSIFVKLSDEALYEKRLRERGSETEASIKRRLSTGKMELARADEYQNVIYNDDLEVAVEQFQQILVQYLAKNVSSK